MDVTSLQNSGRMRFAPTLCALVILLAASFSFAGTIFLSGTMSGTYDFDQNTVIVDVGETVRVLPFDGDYNNTLNETGSLTIKADVIQVRGTIDAWGSGYGGGGGGVGQYRGSGWCRQFAANPGGKPPPPVPGAPGGSDLNGEQGGRMIQLTCQIQVSGSSGVWLYGTDGGAGGGWGALNFRQHVSGGGFGGGGNLVVLGQASSSLTLFAKDLTLLFVGDIEPHYKMVISVPIEDCHSVRVEEEGPPEATAEYLNHHRRMMVAQVAVPAEA